MAKFTTKTNEVEAYEFDGSLRSAAEIGIVLDAIELRYDKNGLGSEGRLPGPKLTIHVDFAGGVTLGEGDWVVRALPNGPLTAYAPAQFIAEFEEKPTGG